MNDLPFQNLGTFSVDKIGNVFWSIFLQIPELAWLGSGSIYCSSQKVSHVEMLVARIGMGEAATCFFEGTANKEDAF